MMVEISQQAANVFTDLLEDTLADMEHAKNKDPEMWTPLDEERYLELCTVRREMISL